jgi:multicomponent Na+:H+ antiporter subunit G
MTEPLVDAVIFILLVLSAGFGGIGVIGLLVFPDIRTRMYTATRAPLISVGAMMLAAILYALSLFFAGGGDQYLTLIFHILVLLCVVVVANVLVYRMILGRTKPVSSCQVSSEQTEERK